MTMLRQACAFLTLRLVLGCGVTEEPPPQPTPLSVNPLPAAAPAPASGKSEAPATLQTSSTAEPASEAPATDEPEPAAEPDPDDEPEAAPPSAPEPPASVHQPGPSGAPAPGGRATHLEPGCGGEWFQLAVGTKVTTCGNAWSAAQDVIQIVAGDAAGRLPPRGGRSYRVQPLATGRMFPVDGQATALLIGQISAQAAISGSVTVDPWNDGTAIGGVYELIFADGTRRKGAFTSDVCPIGWSDCTY